MRYVELLAPAKNLACGKAAIDHGADAVYVGASRFGARASAGNSLDDIAELCRYAHLFGARVYVTVNTIIYDSEFRQTTALVEQLQQVGVDAILVQDMGLLSHLASHPEQITIPLHASTQTDNRSAEKVEWLRSLGIRRAVLARELSLSEIRDIHESVPDAELEVFVHGALCVSYSGLCYASEYCFRRSANRGECAQFCRMKFSLKDSRNQLIERDKYLLSLKDLCQIERIGDLLEAGACSLKIEGRLKDVAYVKNVVAAYSQELDRVIARSNGKYRRSSFGRVEYRFEPSLDKTFNRGFTNYFLDGRRHEIASFLTPKAIGQRVGRVKTVAARYLTVAGISSFANGDGLCFISDNSSLEGFRVNKVEGGKLFPQRMPDGLRPGMVLYRNHDVAFSQSLQGESAVRKVPVSIELRTTADGFMLTMEGCGLSVSQPIVAERQQANSPQRDFMQHQLSKLGNTVFEATRINVTDEASNSFLQGSKLADARRAAVDRLEQQLELKARRQRQSDSQSARAARSSASREPRLTWQREYQSFPYLYNISNDEAREFYRGQGLAVTAKAFELLSDAERASSEVLIMQCRHCLRFSLGYCQRHGGRRPEWKEPLYIELSDKRRFRLDFDCKACQMNIYSTKANEDK